MAHAFVELAHLIEAALHALLKLLVLAQILLHFPVLFARCPSKHPTDVEAQRFDYVCADVGRVGLGGNFFGLILRINRFL